MLQLTGAVRKNAQSAHSADQLERDPRARAERGSEVVGEAIVAMAGIESASSRIAHIIDVVDEIAFQTNLLALNAAVEAASRVARHTNAPQA